MGDTVDNVWLAGVDGCPGGWIGAFVRPAGGETTIGVFARFADVMAATQADWKSVV